MVLATAARLAVTGAVVGAGLAVAIGQLLRGLLVSVTPADPVSFGGAAAAFFVVLLAAAWLPARRAATTAPATALRAE